jgi:hypothetical protein
MGAFDFPTLGLAAAILGLRSFVGLVRDVGL